MRESVEGKIPYVEDGPPLTSGLVTVRGLRAIHNLTNPTERGLTSHAC